MRDWLCVIGCVWLVVCDWFCVVGCVWLVVCDWLYVILVIQGIFKSAHAIFHFSQIRTKKHPHWNGYK